MAINSLPVSTSLLAEVNAVGEPGREKAQDGTIGDRTHSQSVSDHNPDESGNTGSSSDSDAIDEVHARDVDSRGPWRPGWSAERIVQMIVADTRRRGYVKRRVKYVISRRRIWQWRQISPGVWQFVQEVYTGSDPHDLHFHVSFAYGSGAGAGNPENDTTPWGILAAFQEEDDMPFTPQDFAQAMADFEVYNPYSKRMQKLSEIWGYTPSRAPHEATQKQLAAIAAQLSSIAADTGATDLDEAAIVQGILAGLDDAVAQRFLDQLAERFNLKLVPATSGDSPA